MRGQNLARFLPTIRQLLSKSNTPNSNTIEVHGWVKSVRRQKNVSFAVISDGSSNAGLQAVLSKDKVPTGLTNGASVRLTGQLVPSRGSGQDKEFLVDHAEVIGECDPQEYPIQKQALSVEYLRDNSHLRARVDSISSMLRIRDSMMRGINRYFEHQGFMYVHTPILTSSDCEGAGETFTVTTDEEEPSDGQHGSSSTSKDNPSKYFFRKKAFLTVSSQLHLEALSTSCNRVYTLSPCFRAERSQTGRHLAEFWMLEAEWAFAKDLNDVCNVVEDVVKKAVLSAQEQEGSRVDLARLQLDRNWQRITYTDAVRELERHQAVKSSSKFDFTPSWGRPLQSEHERWLAQSLGGPVFVTDYPAEFKPFYMRTNPDGKTVACFDLLVPGVGELAGGSLREERLEHLDQAIEKFGLEKGEYEWYRDLRKYGGTPHGGFGLGFERLVSSILGGENVRECIAMPRWAGRILL